MKIAHAAIVFALLLAKDVSAQVAQFGIRLVRPFDGTSTNFISFECANASIRARVDSFERRGDELRFRMVYPQSQIESGIPAYISMEQYVDPSIDLGESINIVIDYRPNSLRPPESCSQRFNRMPRQPDRIIQIETGWWVDFGLSHRRTVRGLRIDRAIGRAEFLYATFESVVLLGEIPRDVPGIWWAGGIDEQGSYYSLPVSRFLGDVCIACTTVGRERPVTSGKLIFMALSPTTGILAPPNEPARLLEVAPHSRTQFGGGAVTPLTGRWAVLARDDSMFGGFNIVVGPGDITFERSVYPLTFAFGTGRVLCPQDAQGTRCDIFLKFSSSEREFLLFSIPQDGLGNQRLYVQDSSGWRPVMVRID